MRCAACHRTLLMPAYTAPACMGGYVLGRVCAEKAGMAPKRNRKARVVTAVAIAVQTGRLGLFEYLSNQAIAAPDPGVAFSLPKWE